MNVSKKINKNKLAIFLIMFSTGLASILYEVVLISVVNTIVGATELSLSIVLASFLLGLAVGALIGGKIIKTKLHLIKILILLECLVALFGFAFLSILAEFVSSGIHTHIIFVIIVSALLIPTILMGMEIPLAVAILEKLNQTKETGFVYFSDTLGGVIGALCSGLFFIPLLGFHGAMYFGALLNVFTAFIAWSFTKKQFYKLMAVGALVIISLITIIMMSTPFLSLLKLQFMNSFFSAGSAYYEIYYSKPVYATQSPYQHIMILHSPFYGNQLLLDGKEQISEKGSLQYHEHLVLPALAAHGNVQKVLLIGGGDGGALYQLLNYDIESIDHVDLDTEVIEVSRKYLPLVHRGSLDNSDVNRHIADGRQFIKNTEDNYYDVIILDLPDPSKLGIAHLYSKEFFEEIHRVLNDKGIVVTQFVPPYFYLEGFTSAYKTIHSVFPDTYPYIVPGSLYGSIGFIISGKNHDPRDIQDYSVKGVWYDPKKDKMFELSSFLDKYLANNSVQITTDNNPIIHVYMQNNYFYKGVADDPKQGR